MPVTNPWKPLPVLAVLCGSRPPGDRVALEADRGLPPADLAARQYKPQLLTRLGRVDLQALGAKVREDVSIARDWKRH